MRNIILGAALFLVLVEGRPVYAWNNRGHKIVASIAFRQMTPAQRGTIVAILEQHPRFTADFVSQIPADIAGGDIATRQEWLFQQAAIWPDLAKSGPPARRAFNRERWHFINRPHFLTEADRAELQDTVDVNLSTTPPMNQLDAPEMNLIQAIFNSSRIIVASNQLNSTKAIHICWLFHTIGDLHQGLHSSALFSRRLFPQ